MLFLYSNYCTIFQFLQLLNGREQGKTQNRKEKKIKIKTKPQSLSFEDQQKTSKNKIIFFLGSFELFCVGI